MSTASEEITNLLATYAKNTDGKFFLEKPQKTLILFDPAEIQLMPKDTLPCLKVAI